MEGGNAVRKANMGAQKGKDGRDWIYFTISNKYEFVDSLQTPIFLPVRRCEVCNIAGCVQIPQKRRMIKVLSLYAAQSFFYLQESHPPIFPNSGIIVFFLFYCYCLGYCLGL